MQELPLQVLTEVEVEDCGRHHLPDKNWGRELIHTGEQKIFDRLFEGEMTVLSLLMVIFISSFSCMGLRGS